MMSYNTRGKKNFYTTLQITLDNLEKEWIKKPMPKIQNKNNESSRERAKSVRVLRLS